MINQVVCFSFNLNKNTSVCDFGRKIYYFLSQARLGEEWKIFKFLYYLHLNKYFPIFTQTIRKYLYVKVLVSTSQYV